MCYKRDLYKITFIYLDINLKVKVLETGNVSPNIYKIFEI